MNDKSIGKSFRFGYVPELDGMRAFAILAVMLFHAGISIFGGGFIGVDIFFVLSGFLITSLLIKEYDKEKNISLKGFYIRRVLRLIPALILLLFVYLTLSFIFLTSKEIKANLIDSFIVLFYGANWARAFQIHAPAFLGHAWSLSIEEQFYILWPVTLYFFLRKINSRRKIFFIVISLALMSALLRLLLGLNNVSTDRLYNGLDTRADALLIGAALGIALSSNLIGAKLLKTLSKFSRYFSIAGLLILLSVFVLVHNSMAYYYWALFTVEVFTALLILNIFFSERSIMRRILKNKLLVWIGSISYGLYLWHYPIYMTLMKYFNFSHESVLLFGSIATFAVAACSFYFFEKPFLKLKNKLSPAAQNVKIINKENTISSVAAD